MNIPDIEENPASSGPIKKVSSENDCQLTCKAEYDPSPTFDSVIFGGTIDVFEVYKQETFL
jgi:hypothetical protein